MDGCGERGKGEGLRDDVGNGVPDAEGQRVGDGGEVGVNSGEGDTGIKGDDGTGDDDGKGDDDGMGDEDWDDSIESGRGGE